MKPPVELINALRAVCASAKLKNAARVDQAPRLVGERRAVARFPKFINVRKESK